MNNDCFETRSLLFTIHLYTIRLYVLLLPDSVDVCLWISSWLSNQSIIQCSVYFGRLHAQSVYRKLKFTYGEVSRL